VRARYPDLAWAQMTAVRNRLAHAYFGTDHAVLHRIASELLPAMLPRLHEIAAQEGADRQSPNPRSDAWAREGPRPPVVAFT
jgi:uncharacterized protein with HEPN domain